MKKILLFSALILCVIFVFVGCGPSAVASGECGDSAKWALSEDGVLTISGSGEMKPTQVRPWNDYKGDIFEVVIGDGITSISGLDGLYNVTKLSIGKDVKLVDGLSCLYLLESIVIPEGVETIGADAFGMCEKLREITLPSTIKTIERDAFLRCENLKKVNVNDIAAWCAVDIDGFFASPFNCGAVLYVNGSEVTSLTIPNGVSTIGEYQFAGLKSIVKLEVSDSVTSIESNAFRGCGDLVSVKLGSSVSNIAYDAFYECAKIFELINTSSMTFVAGNTGSDLTRYAISVHNGESKIIEHEGWLLLPTADENYIVGYVGSPYTLTVPSTVDGVTYGAITHLALSGKERLASITIPSTVTSIGGNALKDCKALCEVVNNSSVEFDKQSALGTTALNIVDVHEGESRIVESDGWLFMPASAPEYEDSIMFGHALVGYKNVEGASTLTLPADYMGKGYHIGAYAFSGLDGITSVTLSDKVLYVSNYAFANCLDLETVTLGANLRKIGNYAFSNCSLKSLSFPSTLESIGNYAFYSNRTLSGTLTIPAALTDIGSFAFNVSENAGGMDFGITFELASGWNEYEANDMLHGTPVSFGDDASSNFRKLCNEKAFRRAV